MKKGARLWSPIIGAKIDEELPYEGIEAAKFLEQIGRAP